MRQVAQTFSLAGRLKRGEPVHLDVSVRNPFQIDGIWLRGNLHGHAGRHAGPPEASAEACRWYREHGFDFLIVRHKPKEMPAGATADGFLPILGDELQPGHVVALGVDPKNIPSAKTPVDLIKAVHAKGGIAVLAHPFWTGWTWDELEPIFKEGLDGFEVANGLRRESAVTQSDQMWIMAINAGFRVAPIGGDDSHDLSEPATGKTWTGVLAEARTAEAILAAVRQGRTYASEGPLIHAIRVEPPGKVVVQCSPCRACFFGARGWPAENVIAPDGRLTERFELDLAKSGYRVHDYLSIVLEDADGSRAWAAPIDMKVQVHH